MEPLRHLLFSLMTFTLFSTAHGFTLNNSAYLTFSKDEIKVNVAKNKCKHIGITDQELLSLSAEAVNRFWNTVSTSRLRIRQGALLEVPEAFYTDSICEQNTNCTPNSDLRVKSDILISCNNNTAENFPSNSILALAIPNNIEGQTLLGSLILINDTEGNYFKSSNRDEMISIIAHEIGHAIGLGHSPVEDSLMYYATMAKRKSIGLDDIDGITYLYPKEQPISICGSVAINSTNHTNHTDWWGGLFIGLALAMVIQLKRRVLKTSTALLALSFIFF